MALLFAALFGPVGLVEPGGGQNDTLATLGVAPGSEEALDSAPEPESEPQPPLPGFEQPAIIMPPPVEDVLPAIPADPNAPQEQRSSEGELTEI
ncbi:hypothetical protein KCG44_10545 [Pacificimonas sp. WHA3]|uniref:Uncharacterized protein n=1 Tax=Pacificimonas pallii TaxID=2827236 RepID=A0ABS6SG40_9SPHN|nr:hypothetical protein [Pacificimonas pallii]MBV7257220.1 hypothetical protein [Pacificimonas pallii]